METYDDARGLSTETLVATLLHRLPAEHPARAILEHEAERRGVLVVLTEPAGAVVTERGTCVVGTPS
jgi:hypothetical protein